MEYTVGYKEEGLICISGQFTLSTYKECMYIHIHVIFILKSIDSIVLNSETIQSKGYFIQTDLDI